MLKMLSDFRFGIRARLAVSFGILLTFMLAVNVVAIRQMAAMHRSHNTLTKNIVAGTQQDFVRDTETIDHFGRALIAEQGVSLVNENVRNTFDLFFLANDSAAERTQFAHVTAVQSKTSAQITTLFQHFESIVDTASERTALYRIDETRGDYLSARNKAQQLLASGDRAGALRLLHGEVVPELEVYLHAWSDLVALERTLALSADTAEATQYQDAQYVMLIIFVLSIAFSAGIAYIVTRHIAISLRRIRDAAVQLASGQMHSRIATASRDEFGDLANAFNRMADALHASHLDLMEHQHMLEQRVAARTQELTQANANLTELNRKLSMATVQLVQSDKLASLGQLAAGVAHEINNPLGYVHSNLGVLERYLAALFEMLAAYEALESHWAAEQRHALHLQRTRLELDYIRTDAPALLSESIGGIKRVAGIVQHLKSFSRIEAHSDWTPANLHDGIDATLKIIAHEIKYKADVVRDYGTLPDVDCRLSELNQVFLNLLLNSVQAIDKPRGTIVIRTRADADHVYLEFNDDGCGIAPEHLTHIFEPFFTTQPVGKGSGLGLSIAYGIVQQHGGRIEVASQLGAGTTFTITLPIHRGP